MAFHELEQYQLTMGHVVTHPELEHAVRDAAADNGGNADFSSADGIDALPYLEKRGFVLPPGSTVRLRVPKTESTDAPAEIIVCISVGGHDYCASWTPPITITTI